MKSGDQAVRAIAEWVEENSSWDESLMIVTADHGHMLNLVKPEALITTESQNKMTANPSSNVKKSE